MKEYNFFDGLGTNKKAQGAVVFGALSGLLLGYMLFKPAASQ